jgi:putative transcriptional regulator
LIIFKDILKKLSAAGWSTYRLLKERQLPNSVISRLRHGDPITTNTVDTICRLLNCQPNDIMEYIEVDVSEESEEGRD